MKGIIRNNEAGKYTFFNFTELHRLDPEEMIWKYVMDSRFEDHMENIRITLGRSFLRRH